MDPPKPMALKDLKSLENNAENEQASMSMPSLNDKALNIKVENYFSPQSLKISTSLYAKYLICYVSYVS